MYSSATTAACTAAVDAGLVTITVQPELLPGCSSAASDGREGGGSVTVVAFLWLLAGVQSPKVGG